MLQGSGLAEVRLTYSQGSGKIERKCHLAPFTPGITIGDSYFAYRGWVCSQRRPFVNYFTWLIITAGISTNIATGGPGTCFGSVSHTEINPSGNQIAWRLPVTMPHSANPVTAKTSLNTKMLALKTPASSTVLRTAQSGGHRASVSIIRNVTQSAHSTTIPTPSSSLSPSSSSESALAPNPSSRQSHAAAPPTQPGLQAAYQMIALINQARVTQNLAPYTVNPTLMKIAEERATALANGGVFTHDLPGLGLPLQMEQAAGINASGMGAENIAEASTVSQAFQMLMASREHRSNILNPYETQIGVGVASLPNGLAISELFVGPNY